MSRISRGRRRRVLIDKGAAEGCGIEAMFFSPMTINSERWT
jgi:hypothetical protein